MLTEKHGAGKHIAGTVGDCGARPITPRTAVGTGIQAIAGTCGRNCIASRILSSG